VLSPTHLHEFKSADRIYTQPPVMSLFLGDQKLGSHSQPGSTSHKFMLKGRQTGAMHRGHTWVFRAETYDTMLAWYDDIKSLTESSTEERRDFVRKHARSISAGSAIASSVSGDSALEEDEADQIPYSANESMTASKELDGGAGTAAGRPQRPSPGGRFPSDLQVPFARAHSASSGEFDERRFEGQEQQDVHVMTGGLQHQTEGEVTLPSGISTGGATNAYTANPTYPKPFRDPYAIESTVLDPTLPPPHQSNGVLGGDYPKVQPQPDLTAPTRPESQYGEWMAPAAVGAGVGTAALGEEEYWRNRRQRAEEEQIRNTVPANPPVHDSVELSSPAMTESTAPTSVSGGDMTKDHAAPLIDAAIPTPVDAIRMTDPIAEHAAANSAFDDANDGNLSDISGAFSGAIAEDKRTAYDTDRVTGKPNAKLTGAVFPAVIRHNTDVSASRLHVPGEFPS